MKLYGLHHVTSVTRDAKGNLDFYTKVLGLRLVKKTVNQDDVSAYHLFYADQVGSPGTDMTFFDWNATPEKRGTDSVVRTGYRVLSKKALIFWKERLDKTGVVTSEIVSNDGRDTLFFEDPEGQRLMLVADSEGPEGVARSKSDIPTEHQLQGLGPVFMSVASVVETEEVLTKVMGMTHNRSYEIESTRIDPKRTENEILQVKVFGMEGSGTHAELHVVIDPNTVRARLGAGGVHHIAFRIPTFSQYEEWAQRLYDLRIPSSGPIDRFYFKSLYFREPSGVLFELATDEPGFASDEDIETLGEKLALPPFLEHKRHEIVAGLKPL